MRKHLLSVKRTYVLAILLLVTLLSPVTLLAQGRENTRHTPPPFLINGKLPHLTKLLMQQWDNPELQLQDEQKKKLLVIRKETIGGVKRLAGEIAPIERQVVQGSLEGKTTEELQPLVEHIARLKSEASILHLQCIYKTSRILDKKQLALLKK